MTSSVTSEILNKIFRKSETQYGLTKFEKIKPSEILDIIELEKGKFYHLVLLD